jgi:hypothetical protein
MLLAGDFYDCVHFVMFCVLTGFPFIGGAKLIIFLANQTFSTKIFVKNLNFMVLTTKMFLSKAK